MFTTCIHCNTDLGRNDVFEMFPVGRRLAFDAARGRLWVVCRACGRWNLSPLDERWETIEAAERRFRDSRLRASTDNVGMARLREGMDLVRIGEAQRPEMAAWRYGDQFGQRRKRQLLLTGAAVGGAASLLGGVMVAGVGVGFIGMFPNAIDSLIHGRASTSIGRIALPDGRLVDVQRKHARMSALERTDGDGPLVLRLESVDGTHRLTGADAMRAAARLLPTVNRFGGGKRQVQDAVSLLDAAGDPMRVLRDIQQRVGARDADARWKRKRNGFFDSQAELVTKIPGALHTLDISLRLAMEMAVHEEHERRAMDGELADLETAWREAEEIAAIADGMFVLPSIEAKVAALRTSVERGTPSA
jgi:hypothetical protein